MDEEVVVVPARAVMALLAERSRWMVLWPGSDAVVVETTGDTRLRWRLSGALVGDSWVVVEEEQDRVRVQYRLEADPAEPGSPTRPRHLPDSPHGRREIAALHQRHLVAWKRSVWSLVAQYEQVATGRRSG